MFVDPILLDLSGLLAGGGSSLDTFEPPVAPDVGGDDETVEARVLENEFGDGYTARAGDGLNAIRSSVNLTWGMLTAAQAAEIVTFFRDHRGYTAFLYTLPADDDERQWVCKRWQRVSSGTESWAIRATFTEVFDP